MVDEYNRERRIRIVKTPHQFKNNTYSRKIDWNQSNKATPCTRTKNSKAQDQGHKTTLWIISNNSIMILENFL